MKTIAALFGLLTTFSAIAQPAAAPLPPIEKADESTIGYQSVDEALAAVRADPRARARADRDWLVFEVSRLGQPDHALWYFSTPAQASHPSAIKRTIRVREGQAVIDMDVKCDAAEEACLNMIRDFQQINLQYQNMLNKPL
ncbi:hypothetical protein ACFONG_14260 [Uliginosibacterium paludis]|uniref:Molecular chaperone DnaJ n=1 Tax=Uliginosibacterium paludis TaxID=1615952 RepID=A0ABV2CVT2_9RHOO